MNDFLSKLLALQSFIAKLTWKKIFQFATLIFIILASWSTYELRDKIYSYITQPKISGPSLAKIKISKATSDKIKGIVDKSQLIIGIQILVVDFQKNTRVSVLMEIDDRAFSDAYDKFISQGLSELPIFTNDPANNRRMIDLINGEFVCVPYSETTSIKFTPEISKHVTTVCSNGIPPYYGRFYGMVNIFTSRDPEPEEKDQIRTVIRVLSGEINDRDFK